MVLGLISALAYLQIGTLSYFQFNSPALGAEPGTESAEEREHEENTNVPNGFSPANPHPNASQPANATIQNFTYARLKQEISPVLGNPSSPITIIEFGDFQCHFCGRFARDTEPQLNQTYIQTGKVNLVFKHFVTHVTEYSLVQENRLIE